MRHFPVEYTAPKHMKKSHMKRSAFLLGSVLLAATLSASQEKEPEIWLPEEAMPGRTQDPRKQLEEAFQRVEVGLQGMNLLLLDASKGDTTRLGDATSADFEQLLQEAEGRPQGAPTEALAELLYASQGEGQNVLDGIDEILRIAAENSGGSSSGSGL